MSQRKPGLWLPMVRVEAEDVRAGHKKTCEVCGKLPEGRRLSVRVGSGRSQFSYVLCAWCGANFCDRRRGELVRLERFIKGYGVPVRVDPVMPGDPSYRKPKAKCPFKKGQQLEGDGRFFCEFVRQAKVGDVLKAEVKMSSGRKLFLDFDVLKPAKAKRSA